MMYQELEIRNIHLALSNLFRRFKRVTVFFPNSDDKEISHFLISQFLSF